MKYLLYLLLPIVLLSSCQIDQELTFKEDYSGSYSLSMDLSRLYEMMTASGKEANFNDSLRKSFNTDSIEQLKGISNVIVETSDTTLRFAFDFDDAKILEKAKEQIDKGNVGKRTIVVTDDDESDPLNGMDISINDKVFHWRGQRGEYTEDNQASGFGDQFVMSYKLHFPNEIDSINIPNTTLSEDGKSVEFSATVNEMLIEPNYEDITIFFK